MRRTPPGGGFRGVWGKTMFSAYRVHNEILAKSAHLGAGGVRFYTILAIKFRANPDGLDIFFGQFFWGVKNRVTFGAFFDRNPSVFGNRGGSENGQKSVILCRLASYKYII